MEDKKIQDIPFSQLLFDPKNPRLPGNVQNGGSDSAVYEFMLSKSNVTDLMLSIAESGFFSGEPILVVPVEDGSENYYVVEGNRRLAAIRLLHSPELAPVKKNAVNEIAAQAINKPLEIPCVIYPDRSDVLDFLGYRHITGIDEWDSLMKARYLKDLFDHYIENGISQPPQVYSVLAKKIGSRSDAVKKLLDGFSIYKKIEENDFYNISDLNESNFSFSLLTTALSYSRIREFVKEKDDSDIVNDEHLKDLTKWIFEKNSENKTVIGESRNLRILNSVVAAPIALEKLRSGTPLEEAELLSDHPSTVFSESVTKAFNRLKDAKLISHRVQAYSQNDLENLKEINSIVRELYVIVKSNLESTNFELP